jgi:predicted Rossmann fold nucleotide-binding protein DprA/Smf involved in DNA uptake
MKRVAIAGTRYPSPQAEDLVRGLVKALGENGYSIITGGARGIDSLAIKYAMAFSVPYIVIKPSGIKPSDFVERDKLIAEGAIAIVVPEARAGTAKYACCGTWYTAVKFGVQRGKPAFIFKPLVNDRDVQEAFEIMVRDGVKPVESIEELIEHLKQLG